MNKQLAKKMINTSNSTDKALQIGFDIKIDSLIIKHAHFKLTVNPKFLDFGTEVRYTKKILKEMANSDRIFNQYNFKKQTVFSAIFDKQDKDNQVLGETELFINLKTNQNLTEIGNFKNDDISPLKQ